MFQNGGMIVVANEKGDLLPMHSVIGWHICIDYQMLNAWIKKDHFLMTFMDQILNIVMGHGRYWFFDYYSGYNRIYITLED